MKKYTEMLELITEHEIVTDGYSGDKQIVGVVHLHGKKYHVAKCGFYKAN